MTNTDSHRIADQRRLFEELGYRVVKLFSPADLDHLRAGYERMASESSTGFHDTMYNTSREFRRGVYQLIAPLVTQRLRGVLAGQRPDSAARIGVVDSDNSQHGEAALAVLAGRNQAEGAAR